MPLEAAVSLHSDFAHVTPFYIRAMAYNTSCAIRQQCSLRFYATPAHGSIYNFSGSITDIGVFVICYEDQCAMIIIV